MSAHSRSPLQGCRDGNWTSGVTSRRLLWLDDADTAKLRICQPFQLMEVESRTVLYPSWEMSRTAPRAALVVRAA